ncbi:MAG: DUF4249 family protein [Bacteroidetes bacterium]|nr:MAG: DUF4249 family protein [Bacteroidota bacterium]
MHKKFYFPGIRFFALACIFTCMLMPGCEKEADWELYGTKLNTVVVDGMITNEFQIQQIQLSRPVMEMNELPEPFTGASVSVSWGQQTVFFSESATEPGIYYSNQPFATAVDIDYILHIQKDDLVFNAQTHMVPVSPFSTPTFQFHPSLNKYSINWNNSQYSPFEQAMYEAIIDWSHIPGYEHPDSLSMARMLYYTLNTIDVSFLIFPQDKEEVFFPAGSIVSFSKYSLNDDFGAYLRALLSETQWQGSLFEAARSNLTGNISNGGLGYFSACAVIRIMLVVE